MVTLDGKDAKAPGKVILSGDLPHAPSTRVIIAGPNLTIDRTSRIAELRPGEVLRVADVAVTPGGKGLNVARAALLLRAPASLVGFIPGYTGRAAAAMIAEEGITLQGIHVAGEIRSTAIVLEPGGRATVLNEPGPVLERDAWVALEAVVDDDLPDHGVLVCSGSLPPGAPENGYATAGRAGARCGAPLGRRRRGACLGGCV